jgi:hypothetical protein
MKKFIDRENMDHPMRTRLWLLGVLSVGMLIIAALAPPLPQPEEYHQFADQREYFGIPNFFNAASNVGFLLVGAAGVLFIIYSGRDRLSRIFVEPSESWPYLVPL